MVDDNVKMEVNVILRSVGESKKMHSKFHSLSHPRGLCGSATYSGTDQGQPCTTPHPVVIDRVGYQRRYICVSPQAPGTTLVKG